MVIRLLPIVFTASLLNLPAQDADLDDLDKQLLEEIAAEDEAEKKIGKPIFRLNRKQWLVEFERKHRVNAVELHLGEGIYRPRRLFVETFDLAQKKWVTAAMVYPKRHREVAAFQSVETDRLRVTVPWGKADIKTIQPLNVPAVLTSVRSSLFRIHQPGMDDDTIPIMSVNEFLIGIKTLKIETDPVTLSALLVTRIGDKEKVVARTDKPVTLDSTKEKENKILLKAGGVPGNAIIRFQLKEEGERKRPFQVLEYPVRRTQTLRAETVSPWYRKSLFSSQKQDTIEVEALLALPVAQIKGLKGLSVRLAIGRKEFPYRLKEYRTTGMVPFSSRRHRFKLSLEDTPPGRFKARVTIHQPPVLNQAGLAVDDVHLVPPSKNEVWLDKEGRLHINAEPFFPIGFTNVPDDAQMFEEMAAAGVNSILIETPNAAALERAGKAGLKVIGGIKIDATSGIQDENLKEPILKLVAPLSKSSHLLAWACDARKTEDLLGLPVWRAIESADPYHPFITLHGTSFPLQTSAQICDVLGASPAGRDLPLESRLHFIEEAKTVARARRKGVFAVLPNLPPEKLRCLIYGAIAVGAQGILLEWKSWPESRSLVQEVGRLLSVFMAKRRAISRRGDAYPFPMLYARTATESLIIVVNNLPEKRKLSWSGNFGERSILSGKFTGKALMPRNGVFTDSFGSFEVKLYDVKE